MVPDFASYRGFLVLGGNQVSSIFDNNWVTGQAQSGLWFGKTDDLWGFGKPQGWGGVWRYDAVAAGEPSDAYLMTGFNNKVVHLRVDPPAADFATRRSRSISSRDSPTPRRAPAAGAVVTFSIQIDFDGAAGHTGIGSEGWNEVATVSVNTSSNRYASYVFPPGFSAHWIRFVTDTDANVTAYLTYT